MVDAAFDQLAQPLGWQPITEFPDGIGHPGRIRTAIVLAVGFPTGFDSLF